MGIDHYPSNLRAKRVVRNSPAGARPQKIANILFGMAVAFIPASLLYAFQAEIFTSDFVVEGWFVELTIRYVPIYLLMVILTGCFLTVKTVPDAIWTPFFWLPLQSAVFFIFGSMVGVWGDADIIWRANLHALGIERWELLNVYFLLSVSIPLVFVGLALALAALPKFEYGTNRSRLLPSRSELNRLISPVFVVIFLGATFRYGVVQPVQWGQSSFVIPGVLSSMSVLLDLGFGILTYIVAVRRNPILLVALLAGLTAHIYMTFLSFSKNELVIALIIPLLGWYLAKRSIAGLALGGLVVAIAFTLYTPVVSHGRDYLNNLHGSHAIGSLSERQEALSSFEGNNNRLEVSQNSREADQEWWWRLNYANAIAHAMNLHDRGVQGNSLETAWMRFVPRAVWPGKPILEGPGREFYGQVTGRETDTLVGLSIYGDLYWQLGWVGLIIFCPIIGFGFGFLGRHVLKWVVRRNFVYFPLVLYIIISAAQGPNKYLVNGIIGSIPIIVSYWLLINIAQRLLGASRARAIDS